MDIIDEYRSQINDLNTVIARIGRLSSFFNKIETVDAVTDIFQLFIEELRSLFSIKYAGLLLLDKQELEFQLVCSNPPEAAGDCSSQYAEEVDAGVFGWAISQNKFSVLPDRYSADSVTVIFPLKRNRRVFGAVLAKLDADKDIMNSEQQSYLSVFFKQLTMAIGNAVYLEQINRQRNELEKYRRKIEAELLSAKKIQENIIPKKFPVFTSVFFNAYYQPYEKIGGDFYDVLKINERRFMAVIADVSGHGVPAALGTSAIKSAVYGGINPLHYDFQASVASIIRNLQVSFTDEQYATLFLGDFDLSARRITYASFGHMPVIQHNQITNVIQLLESNNLFVSSLEFENIKYNSARIGETDTFLMYTDGIIESANKNGDMFGLEKLISLVKSSRKELLLKTLLKQNAVFCAGEVIDDDIAILQISFGSL